MLGACGGAARAVADGFESGFVAGFGLAGFAASGFAEGVEEAAAAGLGAAEAAGRVGALPPADWASAMPASRLVCAKHPSTTSARAARIIRMSLDRVSRGVASVNLPGAER